MGYFPSSVEFEKGGKMVLSTRAKLVCKKLTISCETPAAPRRITQPKRELTCLSLDANGRVCLLSNRTGFFI